MMTEESQAAPKKNSGFTLVEMVVALAVLAVLVILLAQVINSVARLITKAGNHIQCDMEAQSVFDRLSDDIAQIINRSDVDSIFLGMSTNTSGTNNDDQFYFYSQGAGFSTNTSYQNPVALIGYRVNNRRLERLGITRGWDDLPFITASNSQTTFVATNPLVNFGAAGNYFHTIAPSVFRMEVALLMKDGTVNADGSVNAANSYANLTSSNAPWHGLTNVMAVVVAIALLDQSSRKIATTAQLDSLALSMPNGSTNGGVSIATWTSMALTATNFPVDARSQIRIYQRSFPVKR